MALQRLYIWDDLKHWTEIHYEEVKEESLSAAASGIENTEYFTLEECYRLTECAHHWKQGHCRCDQSQDEVVVEQGTPSIQHDRKRFQQRHTLTENVMWIKGNLAEPRNAKDIQENARSQKEKHGMLFSFVALMKN